MEVSIEEKKTEALARMEQLQLYPDVIKQFKNDNLINQSEPPFGACFWIDEDIQARVKEFEAEYNALVYHVIKTLYECGAMYSFLYVSDQRDEWPLDREDLTEGVPYCYCHNTFDPQGSEVGRIGIKLGGAAGLLRTY